MKHWVRLLLALLLALSLVPTGTALAEEELALGQAIEDWRTWRRCRSWRWRTALCRSTARRW